MYGFLCGVGGKLSTVIQSNFLRNPSPPYFVKNTCTRAIFLSGVIAASPASVGNAAVLFSLAETSWQIARHSLLLHNGVNGAPQETNHKLTSVCTAVRLTITP